MCEGEKERSVSEGEKRSVCEGSEGVCLVKVLCVRGRG